MISYLAESRFPIKRNSDFHTPDGRWISPRIIQQQCFFVDFFTNSLRENSSVDSDKYLLSSIACNNLNVLSLKTVSSFISVLLNFFIQELPIGNNKFSFSTFRIVYKYLIFSFPQIHSLEQLLLHNHQFPTLLLHLPNIHSQNV